MRIILYTGKGGVGKTTIAAATAIRSAELGYRTIILSTDLAHSLSDCLDIQLSGNLQPITKNLWGQEINFLEEIDNQWESIRNWALSVAKRKRREVVAQEGCPFFSGMEELVSLLDIVKHHDSKKYHVLIVDCAPTGEALRLLNFPDRASWYLKRVFPIQRRATTIVRPIVNPIVKALLNVSIPDDQIMNSIEGLFSRLDKMHSILTDPEKTSVRMVVNPEKIVIKETQRTFAYLGLYGYFTDLVICNRILPDIIKDRYFFFWKRAQNKYYRLIEECFSPIPILKVPLMEKEIVGVPHLTILAKEMFKEEDPTKIFFHGKPSEIEKKDGYYILSLLLPFFKAGDISLSRSGDELFVEVGTQRRNLILPRTLARLPIEDAKLEEDKLRIRFIEKG